MSQEGECTVKDVIQIENESTKIFNKITQGTDIELRTETERFDDYDMTASSGNSNTILLIETKKRNIDFGKYESTFIEEDKAQRVVEWAQHYSQMYPQFTIIPVFVTLFKNGIHTLHKLTSQSYITERKCDHYTVSDNNERINKQFRNFPIFNFDRIFRQ